MLLLVSCTYIIIYSYDYYWYHSTPLESYLTPPMRGINERSMIIYTYVWWFVVQILIFKFVSLKDEKFHRKLKSLTMYQDDVFASVFFQLKCTISPLFREIGVFVHFRLFPYIMLLNRCCAGVWLDLWFVFKIRAPN